MVRASAENSRENSIDWGDPDRFNAGIDLLQKAKSKLLVFTGGMSPWEPDLRPEGAILSEFALQRGVREDQILISGIAYNTEDEAREVKKKLSPDQREIILVTSAIHMPRAVTIFKCAGFLVHPYPVDFKIQSTGFYALQLLPKAEALAVSDSAVRELIGRIYYDIRCLG